MVHFKPNEIPESNDNASYYLYKLSGQQEELQRYSAQVEASVNHTSPIHKSDFYLAEVGRNQLEVRFSSAKMRPSWDFLTHMQNHRTKPGGSIMLWGVIKRSLWKIMCSFAWINFMLFND